jgi:uncharacterized protein
MMDYPAFRANEHDVALLLAEQRMVRLITVDAEGWPRVGLHVHTSRGLLVEIHLVNTDPALEDIERSGKLVLEVDEIMSSAPSHWVDGENASHADQFYRHASLRGTVEVTRSREALVTHLTDLLAKQQPEGRYATIDARRDLYDHYLDRLTLVRMQATEVTSKFKLAQRTPQEARERIVDGLRSRAAPADLHTAALVEQVSII